MIDSLLPPERAGDDLMLVKFHGFTMYADHREVTVGFRLGLYEPATTFVFKRLLQPGDIVVDIGAHWGYFTLLSATLCGGAGKVFAFEPHPRNYALLRKGIEANCFTNVVATQKAVSNQSGTAKLLLGLGSGLNSLRYVPPQFQVPQGSEDQIIVDTVTLDNFFSQHPIHPKIIKMDIEGAEPLALEGMRNMIEQNPDLVLITEFLPHYLGANIAEDFLGRLRGYGFEVVAINDDLHQLEVGSASKILERARRSGERGKGVTNLLCIRHPQCLETLAAEQGDRCGVRNAPHIVKL
jgi:FkbM family methyltransferase